MFLYSHYAFTWSNDRLLRTNLAISFFFPIHVQDWDLAGTYVARIVATAWRFGWFFGAFLTRILFNEEFKGLVRACLYMPLGSRQLVLSSFSALVA
jgi:hypothetical protein